MGGKWSQEDWSHRNPTGSCQGARRLLESARIFVNFGSKYISKKWVTAPVVDRRPIRKAVLSVEDLVSIHIVHHVEVAHFVIACGANISGSVPKVVHCATGSQDVTLGDLDALVGRVEHLRLQWVVLANVSPLAISNNIATNSLAEFVRMGPECKWIEGQVLVDEAGSLKVFRLV